jgi:hypothetical protein
MLLSARVFSAACILSFAALLPLGAARGQDNCVEVAFEAGKSETFIFGIAPAEGVVCYRMQAAPGQRYILKVVIGRNIVLGIPGIDDGVDEISFTARRRLYEIRVTQLMRSITSEAFRVQVTLGAPTNAAAPAQRSPPPAAGPSEAAPDGDTAILRAKVTRYAAAWLRSSGLPAGAATPEINLVDLNNDGLPEGISILRGGMTCGARGCTAFVLDLGPVEARNIGDFIAETLQPLATRTNSWRDLAVNGRRVTYRGGRY